MSLKDPSFSEVILNHNDSFKFPFCTVFELLYFYTDNILMSFCFQTLFSVIAVHQNFQKLKIFSIPVTEYFNQRLSTDFNEN